MATTARRFRPDEDWTQTRITTRASSPKEPRDERIRIAGPRGAGVARRPVPVPVDVKLAQAKGRVRLVSNGQSCENEMLREPEIIDLAPMSSTSRPWMGRREISAPPYPPLPPPPFRSKHKLRGPPSVASRQSEMSFGVLDYYIRDPSPLASPDLPADANPPIRPTIDGSDFGLRRESAETSDAKSGADEEMQLIPLSPRPYEEDKAETDQPQAKKYSLFPTVKEVTPSTHRLARVINDSPADFQGPDSTPSHHKQAPGWRPRLLSGAKLINTPTPSRRRADTTQSSAQTTSSPATATKTTTTLPSPSYHPRNPSLTFNNPPSTRLASASISSNSGSSTQTRRIPLRILSSSSTATTHRSSISTSPGSTIASQQKPLLSRWSEDTALASPTTAAAVLGGCRTSFGSLIGAEMMGSGEGYPACFFEDDEEVPLRRRGRRASGKGWKAWLCCCREG